MVELAICLLFIVIAGTILSNYVILSVASIHWSFCNNSAIKLPSFLLINNYYSFFTCLEFIIVSWVNIIGEFRIIYTVTATTLLLSYAELIMASTDNITGVTYANSGVHIKLSYVVICIAYCCQPLLRTL